MLNLEDLFKSTIGADVSPGLYVSEQGEEPKEEVHKL